MKQKTVFYLILIGAFQFGCTSNRQSSDSLPCIDVRKNYPEKEIVLTDIADVTYLHLSTQNDSFLYRGGLHYETENTYLVVDLASYSILFFSKDGNPKSRFNRYGQGPEEYFQMGYENIIYDEATNDVFVPIGNRNYIQVYSSTGKYKRRLTLSDGLNLPMGSIIVSFDNQSLLIFDSSKNWDKFRKIKAGDRSISHSQLNDSSFFLISKLNGKVLEYVDVPRLSTVIVNVINGIFTSNTIRNIVKSTDGYLLYYPVNDTVYHYKNDKTLTPIFCKTPLLTESPNLFMYGFTDVGRYQFMTVSPPDFSRSTYYMRDKETGEMFRPKLVLPNYRGKEFVITEYADFRRYLENEYLFYLNLYELKQADKENKLSGDLKELVDTLNEDKDNDIFMFVKFK